MERTSAATLENPQTALSEELAAVIEQLDVIDAQLSLVHQMKAAEAERDPQLDTRIQELELAAIMADKEPDMRVMLESMAKASRGELAAYLDQNLETMTAALADYEELMQRGEKLVTQELQRLQTFVRQHVTWDALIQAWFTEPRKRPFSLQQLNHLLQPPAEPIDLWKLQDRLVRLQTAKDILTKEGYVADRKPEVKKDDKELIIAEVKEWMDDTQAAMQLLSPSRTKHLLEVEGIKTTDQVASLINSISASADSLDPAIVRALKAVFDHACRQVDQQDAAFIAKEAKTRPNTLIVSGLSHLEKTIEVPNVQEWVYKYVNRLPHWMIEGLGFLNFKPHLESLLTDTELDQAGLRESDKALKAAGFKETGALMTVGKNTVDISVGHVEIDELVKEGFDKEIIQGKLLSILPNDIVHELVHYAHYQTIPLSWLRGWVKVAREEEVPVSTYTKAIKEHGTNTGGSPLAEELADSITKYTNNPVEFIFEASKRFAHIQQLLHTYPDGQIATILQELEAHPHKRRAIKELAPPDELQLRRKQLREVGRAAAA